MSSLEKDSPDDKSSDRLANIEIKETSDSPDNNSLSKLTETFGTTSNKAARLVKKRVRTGCLNCRRKHKKCDEVKPHCTACTSRSEYCEWPTPKLKGPVKSDIQPHFPSQFLPYNLRQTPTNGLTLPVTIPPIQPPHYERQILDNDQHPSGTIQPFQHYPLSSSSFLQAPQGTPSFFQSSSRSTDQPILAKKEDQAPKPKKFKLKRYFLEEATCFRNASKLLLDYMAGSNTSSLEKTTESNLSDYEELLLMKTYTKHIAPQFDTLHVHTNTYRNYISHVSKHSRALRFAIYALSLHYLEATDSSDHQFPVTALSLFESAVECFAIDSSEPIINTYKVATALFLIVFSLRVTEVDEWRGYMKALVNYSYEQEITYSQRLHSNFTLFWTIALLDLNATTLISEGTLMEHDFENLKHLSIVPKITGYMSMTFNLLTLDENFDANWEKIWKAVTHLDGLLSEEFLDPISESEKSPFPILQFSNPASCLAYQLHLTTMTLLIQDKPRLFRSTHPNPHPLPWYAKRICAISYWNKEFMNWGNSPFCLWVAGKVLTHKDEHAVVLRLLDECEELSGGTTKYKSQDLKDFWSGEMNV